MKRLSKLVGAVLAIGACGASTAAFADNSWGLPNPLGLYVGAGVGESTVRSDDPGYGYPAYYNDHETAFKGIIGIRPLPFLGVEAEYIDFGEPGHHRSYDPNFYGRNSHPRAPVLFGIGYLPIPIPYVDLYAKAGVARLKLTLNDYECVDAGCNNFNLVGSHDRTDTKFAYGAGVSSKLPWGFIVRAEYERISSPFGDPDAFTVSALWKF
jgi:outer membrane protein with beta-barrel domain